MNLRLSFSFLVGLTIVAAQTPLGAAEIYGVWSNPIFAGATADAATGALTFYNNTGSSVYSIANGSISWGTYNTSGITSPPGQPDLAGCAFLATLATPCQSTITFAGNTLPFDPSIPFQLGTITYTNGTSNLDSLLFGATLTFYQTGSPNPIGFDVVNFATTINTGTAAQNADYMTFSGLANTSL